MKDINRLKEQINKYKDLKQKNGRRNKRAFKIL